MDNFIGTKSQALILVADDDRASRNLIRRLLQSEGYIVEEAENGLEAFRKCVLLHPTIVLLDALMPHMSGFDVAKQLQSYDETKVIQVVMLTGLNDEESINQAFEVGAVDYISKPVYWPVLRHRLRRLLITKQAEEAMREERNLLRTLIDHLPDYIFIKDAEGRFLISNTAHAQAVQLTVDDLIGKTALELFPKELAEQYHLDDQEVMQSGLSSLNLERITLDPSGNAKTVLTTKVPLRNNANEVIGLVGISRDITERKQAEEKLKQLANDLAQSNTQFQELYERVSALEQLKTDMLRMASHDLRAPLTLILGYAFLMNRESLEAPLPEEMQGYVNEIAAAATRMKKLTEDILSVEKIQSADSSDMITVDLREVSEAAFKENEPHARQKSQAFTLNIPQNPVTVRANSAQIYEAITNLVNNAIKYTPEGGDVEVCLAVNEHEACFEVKDSGYGIPENMQKKLFQPFFRARTEITSHIEGTGLGLHLVKNVIERHHGKMKFQSTQGEGSIFGFQLELINKQN